ncbi:AAA family ATPase [Methanosarcina hadiensis]|uniref:AAA family ATPase n=1 Tax=Methanosarcina hadiensis TaxID=3078083 RepID=UPI0039775328
MRIKTIKINGIRGFHYLDDSTTNPHIIKVNGGNHLFIYGENGTGKSSLFDAMEWAICGEVTNEIKKRNVDNSFIFNEFNKDTASPYVELVFDNSKSIIRKFSNNRISLQDQHKVLTDDMESLFIETNRIEKFVADKKDNLWKNFSELLGLEELLNFERQLKKLKDKAAKEYSNIDHQYRSLNEEIKKLDDELKGQINRFQEIFGNGWVYQISKINFDNISTYNTLSLKKNTFIENYETQISINSLIEKKQSELLEISKNTMDTKIIPLINEATFYFQSKNNLLKCPICDNEIIFSEISSKLKRLKESFKAYNDIKLEIEGLEKSQIRTIESDFNSLKNVIKQLDLLDIDPSINVSKFYNLIKMKNDYLNEKIAQNTSSEILNVKLYFEKIDEIETKKLQLEKLQSELNLKLVIRNDITQVYNKYEIEYISKINYELDNISEEIVTKIYNQINQTENDNVDQIKIKTDIENRALEFIIKFEGSESFSNANKILSTGHLRCLGFALLLTRIIRKNSPLKTILIDDPIYAIDHEHRYYLIKYLQSLGETYQLVILSSDRMFYEILTNTFPKNTYESYEVCLNQIEGICYKYSNLHASASNFLTKAGKHLEQNDLRAASLYARLSFERQLIEIADNVQINIPFKKRDSFSWGDLINADIKAAIVSKYHNTDEHTNDLEFEKVLKCRYFKSLIYGFPLNQEMHYPHSKRPFFTRDEISEVITTIGEFNMYIKKVMKGEDVKILA